MSKTNKKTDVDYNTSLDFCWSTKEKAGCIQFAKQIVPKNWNIVEGYSFDDFVFEPEALNIIVCFRDKDWDEITDYEEEARFGEIHGPMWLQEVSLFKKISKAKKALKKHGCFRVCSAEIWLYPIASFLSEANATIVHELSHVAVNRFFMRQQGGFKIKEGPSIVFTKDCDDQHGLLFQRFYRVLINRTQRIFGQGVAKDHWIYLKFYEEGECF